MAAPADEDEMLKPPTRKQIADYDVSKRDGDRFYVTDAVHMQCQFVDGDLIVHEIAIDEERRRRGMGRDVIRQLRAAYPEVRIVANGVTWDSDAGRFWKAMVEEGFVDAVDTYEDGLVTRETLGGTAPSLGMAP